MTTDLLDRHDTGFQHEALFYADSEELLESLTRFIGAGVAAGDPTLAILSADTIEVLQAHISASSDTVEYRDMTEVGRNPARLLSLWHDFVQKHDSAPGILRGVGEPVWPGRSPEELEECRIHEELLNVAFDHRVSWRLMCPYDTSSLDPVVLERAREAHSPSGQSSEPPSVEESLQILDGPLTMPPPDPVAFRFDADRLRALRKLALWEATRAGVRDKTEDFVFAVNEVATNSLAHGGGRGEVRIWQTDRGVVCEVLDRGYIRDPLVGRKRPSLRGVGGHGLWMANQLCDLVQVRSHPAGTVVRLHMYTT